MEKKYLDDGVQLKLNTQESKEAKDQKLLLDLPSELLRSIIRCAGENNTRSIFEILDHIRCVCTQLKKILNSSGELKNICALSQYELDNTLLYRSMYRTKNDFAFFKSLIAMGANPAYWNSDKTCLHNLSIFKGDSDTFDQYLVKLYLEHGAQINQADGEGNTPLHEAVWYHKTGVIKELLAHGAQLDVKNKKGNTPIDIALRFYTHATTEILKLLIEYTIATAASCNKAIIAEWARLYNNAEIYTLVTGEELPLYKEVPLARILESKMCVIL